MATLPNMLRTGLGKCGLLGRITSFAVGRQGNANFNGIRREFTSDPRLGRVSQTVSSLLRAKEQPLKQEILGDKSEVDTQITNSVISNVNEQIKNGSHGRLFAIVHLAGKQYRVTDGDLVVVHGNWEPGLGDEVLLEKVLLLGSRDFTLVGRPLLEKELVQVRAQVVEKTLSHTITHFLIKRRKQYKRIKFFRIPQTVLRIQGVHLTQELNSLDENARS